MWVDTAFYPPGFQFQMHNHDYAELYYIDQGSGWHCLPEQRRAIKAGDMALIHPDVVHALAASDEEPLLFRNIAIPGSLYNDLAKRFGGQWQWTYTENPPQQHFNAQDLQWFNAEVMRFGNDRLRSDRLQVEAFILGVCARLARHQYQSSVPAWLSDIIAAVRRGEFVDTSVAALAEMAGVSSAYFTRSCSKHFNQSAMEIVLQARLDVAIRLLVSSHEDISQIAEQSGFKNLSNFHRRFKDYVNTTPTKYRQQHGSGFV